jgi:hypothetical protein
MMPESEMSSIKDSPFLFADSSREVYSRQQSNLDIHEFKFTPEPVVSLRNAKQIQNRLELQPTEEVMNESGTVPVTKRHKDNV